jgi:outer membrane protein assembly complex protein YaeT
MRCAGLLVLSIVLPVPLLWAEPGHAGATINGETAVLGSYEIVFQGNEAMSAAELRRAAAAELEAFEREGRSRADIDDAAFQMQIAYRKAGYAFATVEYRLQRDGEHTTVTFTVSEGPRVSIGSISFSGNEAFDRDALLPLFERGRPGLIGNGAIPFMQSDVETAVKEIRQRYTSRGYLDVVVGPPRLDFSDDRSRVDISVTIREGVQYLVHRIDVRGDVVPAAEEALDALRRDMIGQPYFNQQRLMLRTRVLEIYDNRGYPDAVVAVDPHSLTEPGQMLLTAMIRSGPLVTIAEIHVRGNEKTRTAFILDRIRLKSGDLYNAAILKQSLRDLYKTGIVSRVDFDLVATDVPGRRVLVLVVEEAPSKELYFEPGWGSYERVRLRLGFRERNLFGTGRIFGSEGAVSLKARSLSTGLSDPFFLHTDILADSRLFYKHRIEPSFTRTDTGMAFSLTRDFIANLMATLEYTIRTTDISDANVEEDVADSDEPYNFGSLRIQANYDTRDDLFFPTAGQRTFASAELADEVLGGEVNFTRLTGGVRFFFSLGKTTVLGLRYTSGLILPGRDQVSVPLAERFFNGGENTVRSFEESELGPQDASGDPTGGLGFNVLNVELRQRIVGNLTGSLFFDYGNVSPNRNREEQGKPPYDRRSDVISDTLHDFYKDFRPAVGLGFQYLLPVGPARMDFAFNPDRDPSRDDDSFVFHFSVGMAF